VIWSDSNLCSFWMRHPKQRLLYSSEWNHRAKAAQYKICKLNTTYINDPFPAKKIESISIKCSTFLRKLTYNISITNATTTFDAKIPEMKYFKNTWCTVDIFLKIRSHYLICFIQIKLLNHRVVYHCYFLFDGLY
jgi:hypothetical protein